MKFVSTLLIATLLLHVASCQYIAGAKYALEKPRLSTLTRVSMRPQTDLDSEDGDTKVTYFDTQFFSNANFPNDIITFHSERPGTTANVLPITTEVKKNEALVRTFNSLMFKWTPTESMEAQDGHLLIKGSAYDGTTAAIGINGAGEVFRMNANYVVKTDWKNLMYIIFSIIKIFVNIVIVYITFARPFMPEWARLRAIWVGQTVIYYQLLVYSGLVPGVFGWTIDLAHEGMMKASRRYFFVETHPKIDTDLDFVVYKYIQNDFVPKILEEITVEVVSMAVITLIVMFLKLTSNGVRDHKCLRIAREIKSAIYVFAFIPFFVHFCHMILSVSYSKDMSFWSILNIVLGIGLSAAFINQFFRMAQGINDINYLHSRAVYQTGTVRIEQGLDWAFDTYISMDSEVSLRILELFCYLVFASIYATGYVTDMFASIVTFIMYAFLLGANIQKFRRYITGTKERDLQKRITLFSIVHLGLITFNHLIYVLFWVISKMSLKAVKFWTFVWYIVTFIDVIVILAQLIIRLVNIYTKPEYIRASKYENAMQDPNSAPINDRA